MKRADRSRRRSMLALVNAALVVALVPSPAVGQEVGEPVPDEDEIDETLTQMTVLDERLPVHPNVHEGGRQGLLMWPDGRRAYQMLSGGSRLAAYDLDDLAAEPTVSEDVFDPPLVHGGNSLLKDQEVNPANAAVDHATGRLFLPYRHPLVPHSSNNAPCWAGNCLGGVYVVDGHTLEVIGNLPYRPVGVDGATILGYVSAMAYSPSLKPGGTGKLHLLLKEQVNYLPGGFDFFTRVQGGQQSWVVQIDITTGRHDWMARVGACNGNRVESTGAGTGLLGAHSTIFRSGGISDPPELYVGCYRSGQGSAIVRLLPDPDNEDAPPVSQQSFLGPGQAQRYLADPAAKRILVEAEANGTAWWVFDGHRSAFLGVIGTGPGFPRHTSVGLDQTTGRLYVLTIEQDTRIRGMLTADARRNPLPQAVPFVHLHEPLALPNWRTNFIPIAVDPGTATRPTRVFVRPGRTSASAAQGSVPRGFYDVVVDLRPLSADAVDAVGGRRTDDVAEQPGLTEASFTGAARGYGLRAILMGGIENTAMVRNPAQPDNPEKPGGNLRCSGRQNELVFGLVGSHANAAELEPRRAAADATAAYADRETVVDIADPQDRCLPSLQNLGLGGAVDSVVELIMSTLDANPVRMPAEAEGYVWEHARSSCTAPALQPEDEHDQAGDEASPVLAVATEVRCKDGEHLAGRSSARIAAGGLVSVGDASSMFELVRLADGGLVGRVRSAARGIEIEGAAGPVRIDAIEAEGIAWATGRSVPPGEKTDDGGGLDTLEDLLRSAGCAVPEHGSGTCYTRRFVGVSAGDFRCNPCHGREREMAAAINTALGPDWLVRVRDPDPALIDGSEDGYVAGIQKRPDEIFADASLLGDLLPTLPALQITRTSDIPGERGRQTFLFAAVELSTAYGVICLATIIDGECLDVSEPGSIEVSLADTDGQPLAGAVFEVDVDGGDDVLGSNDSLSGGGTCVTGSTGTCTFGPLQAGGYLVRQKVAPPGYDPAPEVPVFLPEGGIAFVNLVNARNTAGIGIVLLDDQEPPAPLEGGVFEVYAGGSNPLVDGGEVLLASCTTDATGGCLIDAASLPEVVDVRPALAGLPPMLDVPLGGYTIRQATAPEGYVPADDVSFELTQPGQLAQVTFRNGRVAAAGDPVQGVPDPGPGEGGLDEPGPVEIVDAAPAAPPVVSFEGGRPRQARPAVASGPPDSGLQRFLQLPAAALSLLTRDPKDAAAFGGLVLLFAAAAAGAWRRRMLSYVIGK